MDQLFKVITTDSKIVNFVMIISKIEILIFINSYFNTYWLLMQGILMQLAAATAENGTNLPIIGGIDWN